MSYPGYPPYQQAPNAMPGNQYPPYPQQQPYPGAGGAPTPYPSQQQYPPAPGGYPPNPGYPPTGAPAYPPQGAPGYPPGPGQYPPQTSPYPPSPYDQTPSPYPAAGGYGGYPPPSQNAYPSAYPPPQSGGGYPGQAPQVSQSYAHMSSSAPAPYAAQEQKKTPTLYPAEPFNPDDDAQVLRKAMKGFGTDEKAIISVLCNRTNAQRQHIAAAFKTNYGKDLIKDLKSETSGNFEDALVALMTPMALFLAKEINHAISGVGTNEDTLIEVMCSMSNAEIHAIRGEYRRHFGSNMEEELRGDTGGTFKRLMTSLCNAARDENCQVDPALAAADAQKLLQAGELRMGTDESTFNMILCRRSFPQLQQTFAEFHRLVGHDIETSIKNEFSGDIEDGLLAVVRCCKNMPAFYAKQLHDALAGLGTKDRKLIRILAIRCEIDLVEIKSEYQAKYGKSLADAVADDCSGDYKKCLLALIK